MICWINVDKLIKFKIGTSPIILTYNVKGYDHYRNIFDNDEFRKIFKIVIREKRNVLLRVHFIQGHTIESLITPAIIKLNHQIKL